MTKRGIDRDALITHFSHATAQQGDALREAAQAASLKGLQARALTLSNTKQVLSAFSGTTRAPRYA